MHRAQLLREIHRRGSMASAAVALGYDASTVSQQMKVLEREVGAGLLERVGRRVRLTPAGLVLVTHAETMAAEMERVEATIASLSTTVSGSVRVATFQSAAHAFVVDALVALRREHPALEVHLAEFDVQHALPALAAREHDLVLLETYPGNTAPLFAGVDVQTLGEDPLLLLDVEGREVDDLADAPWVMEPTGTLARTWSESVCRMAGFEPRVVYDTSDLALQIRLASEGLAVALVPSIALSTVPSTVARAAPGDPHRSLATAVRAGAGQQPAILAARNALRTEFAGRARRS